MDKRCRFPVTTNHRLFAHRSNHPPHLRQARSARRAAFERFLNLRQGFSFAEFRFDGVGTDVETVAHDAARRGGGYGRGGAGGEDPAAQVVDGDAVAQGGAQPAAGGVLAGEQDAGQATVVDARALEDAARAVLVVEARRFRQIDGLGDPFDAFGRQRRGGGDAQGDERAVAAVEGQGGIAVGADLGEQRLCAIGVRDISVSPIARTSLERLSDNYANDRS